MWTTSDQSQITGSKLLTMTRKNIINVKTSDNLFQQQLHVYALHAE